MRQDFGEGLEDEPSLGEMRVRDREPGLYDDGVAVEKDVEVERSGPPPLCSDTALGGFDGEERLEEIAGRQRGVQGDGHVEEVALILRADRGGFKDR